MTPEEAKARVAAQNAELVKVEQTIADLAQRHPAQTLMTIISALVDGVCSMQGQVFKNHHKLRFYRSIIAALGRKGIT